MSIPQRLEEDLARLSGQGHVATALREPTDGNRIYIVFENYALPAGWNRAQTRLLVLTDVSYPNSKLDMFWTEPGLRLATGAEPQAAGRSEEAIAEFRIGMALQCDPTVIYALQRANRYTGNLRRDDLAFDSPYNTYRYPGLPPGPIAAWISTEWTM